MAIQLFPSVRYHAKHARTIVKSQEESDSLGEGWRGSPFSRKEREELGLPPREKPTRPHRNDFDDANDFFESLKGYEAEMLEYDESQNPE